MQNLWHFYLKEVTWSLINNHITLNFNLVNCMSFGVNLWYSGDTHYVILCIWPNCSSAFKWQVYLALRSICWNWHDDIHILSDIETLNINYLKNKYKFTEQDKRLSKSPQDNIKYIRCCHRESSVQHLWSF